MQNKTKKEIKEERERDRQTDRQTTDLPRRRLSREEDSGVILKENTEVMKF